MNNSKIKILLICNDSSLSKEFELHLKKIYGSNFSLKVEKKDDSFSLIEFSKDLSKTDIIFLCITDKNLKKKYIKKYLSSSLRIPVAVIISENNFSYINTFLDYGADDYLIKESVSPENIEKTIRYSLNRISLFIKESDEKFDAQGTVKDFVKGKTKELEKKAQINLYKQMFEIHDGIMLLIDPVTQKIRDANFSASIFYGYSHEDLLNMDIFDINGADDNSIKAEMVRAKDEGRNHFLFLHKTASGELKDVEVYSSPIFFDDNYFLYWIIHDITERKIVERELTKMSTALESSSSMVLILDGQGKIEYLNNKFIEITGYTEEEAMGKTSLFFNSGVHSKDYFFEIWDQIISGKEWKGELLLKKKSGENIWVLASISSLKFNDNEQESFVAIVEDISKRKELEKQLIIAKNSAEEATNAKSHFLANMSHEIRTPLNAIIGLTDLIIEENLYEKQNDDLASIKDASTHLLNLINDILDFSKIEAGKVNFETLDFDIVNLVKSTIYTFDISIKDKNLFLKLNISKSVPRFVKGDPVRVKQILNNLISNAIKFTHKGKIVINVERGKSKGTINLVFKVEDTGIGIPYDRIMTIFDNFEQVEGSYVKYGGTGLGLSITKNLVEMMDGEISVESELDKGSLFTFNIILNEGKSFFIHNDEVVGKIKKKVENLTILLVEDDKINVKLTLAVLKKNNYKVFVANNGVEALDLLSKNSIDVILMDIEMPIMDGIEATIRIRNGEAGEENIDKPVIAITAHVLQDVKKRCSMAGMDGFIAKPINVKELNPAIEKHYIKYYSENE